MQEMSAQSQPELQSRRQVELGPHHHASLTKHSIRDEDGDRNFPAFVSLEIPSYPGEESCYLFHICDDGQMADTWHQTLREAMDQAEWEFGVKQEEWIVIAEPAEPNRYI